MLKDCATCRFESHKQADNYPCNRCIRGLVGSSLHNSNVHVDQWYPFDHPKYVNPNEERPSAQEPKQDNVWDVQVGGAHYKQYAIQPYEFFFKNSIPHHKAAIIRRILRYDHPTGKGREDLEKIKHEIDLILDLWKEPDHPDARS